MEGTTLPALSVLQQMCKDHSIVCTQCAAANVGWRQEHTTLRTAVSTDDALMTVSTDDALMK